MMLTFVDNFIERFDSSLSGRNGIGDEFFTSGHSVQEYTEAGGNAMLHFSLGLLIIFLIVIIFFVHNEIPLNQEQLWVNKMPGLDKQVLAQKKSCGRQKHIYIFIISLW